MNYPETEHRRLPAPDDSRGPRVIGLAREQVEWMWPLAVYSLLALFAALAFRPFG